MARFRTVITFNDKARDEEDKFNTKELENELKIQLEDLYLIVEKIEVKEI